MVGVPEETDATGEDLSSRRFRAILELAALDKSDFDAVLRRILVTDAEVLDTARVNCWSFEPDGIRCVAGYDRVSGVFERGTFIEAGSCPTYFRAVTDDPILVVDDVLHDPRTGELVASYLQPLGIGSMMDVPIWVQGGLWGIVCHEHVGPPRRWSESERDFAISIGHVVSMAVEARARAEAERTARVSELFVGMLSHDLRDPLSTIRASGDYLLRLSSDEAVTKVAHRILRSSDRMSRMVEQLLDFTRIRLGSGLPVRREQVDLAELCQRAASDMSVTRETCAIEVTTTGSTVGWWDPDRLAQVISNLLTNAFEHGETGGRVRIEVDGTGRDVVCFRVANRGVLPLELVPVMFEPFRQARPGERGLGLGLFITRAVVTAHGGTIRVDTSADETVFTVRLPRTGRSSG